MKTTAFTLGALAILAALLGHTEVAAAETRTFVPTDLPKAIADHATVTSNIDVNEMSPFLTDVKVTLGQILHTSDADLKVFLISPRGARVKLFTEVAGAEDNFFQTILDDNAAGEIISGAAPFMGSYQPQGVLSELGGENPNGTWKLEVTDNATGNIGILNNWSLTISAGDPLDWFTTRVTNNNNDDRQVQICGSQVVWEDHDGTDYQIFLHNTSDDTTTKISNNNHDDEYPQLCGQYIVWGQHDGTDYEIMLYDVTTGTTTPLTNNDYDDRYPQICGSTAAWESYESGHSEIFMVRRQVCMTRLSADVDGDCRVDLTDFAQFASQWLDCNLEPPEACGQ